MNVEEVSVSVPTSAPGGATNAYVVTGEESYLVDPAEESEALTRLVGENAIDHLVVTHTHSDHIGGVSYYRDRTDACVWAHESFVSRFREATGVVPDATFREGTPIGEAIVLHMPGHAPDHVVFAFGDIGIAGDMAFEEGSVFVGGTDGDMRAYLTSLRRLLHQDFTDLYPGHGPVITAPEETITRLIHHRMMREQNVLEAVRSGAESLTAIVSEAYEKDVSDVQTLAELSVGAHLEKLRVEKKVTWDGEVARAMQAES